MDYRSTVRTNSFKIFEENGKTFTALDLCDFFDMQQKKKKIH